MNAFIDKSAFLAVLNSADRYDASVKRTWDELLFGDSILLTSNYIVVETIHILQHRFGMDAQTHPCIRPGLNSLLPGKPSRLTSTVNCQP